ncbi:hypothetical protein [Lentzea sp. CA-135723]|uniref:hypothetical protein n=1 Tax=Lentzea sp. CA-135723 TaxID=3239950 RepID=UPI003D8EC630
MFSFHTTDFTALTPPGPVILAKAVDAQPNVPAHDWYDGLDPDLWGDADTRRGGGSREDQVRDNTWHAGLALNSTLRFGDRTAYADERMEEACELALQVYRDTARLVDEEDSAILRELFAGSMHLMDARGIDLHTGSANSFQQLLRSMLFELERLCRGPWAACLAAELVDFEDLLLAACGDYREQIVFAAPENASATSPAPL